MPRVWKQAPIKLILKSCAMEDPSDPAKFHPIALISCIGKVYTSIIKDRWLHFMRDNQYLDTKVQKAFMPSVPGCIKYYTKLATAINVACTCYKSLCVCHFYLANTYGSVHHDLIRFPLQHYHAPSKLTHGQQTLIRATSLFIHSYLHNSSLYIHLYLSQSHLQIQPPPILNVSGEHTAHA